MADFRMNLGATQNAGISSETSSSQKGTVKKKLPPLRSGSVRKPKNIADEALPMVIIVPSETECLTKYAIPLENAESENEADTSMKIIEILNSVTQGVRDLEEMYDSTEEKNAMDGEFLSAFLSFCNRHSTELSSSIQEEHEILESLRLWFETEILLLEEGEDEEEGEPSKADEIPEAGTVESEVMRLREGILKLTELKDRFRDLPRLAQPTSVKGEKKKKASHAPVTKATSDDTSVRRDSQDIQSILQSLQSESKIQSQEVKQKMMQEIAKLFQKQTAKLQKLEKDHGDVQTKYTKMKTDCQVLSDANVVMEKELKKLRGQRALKQEELPDEEVTGKESKKKHPVKKVKEKKGVQPEPAVTEDQEEKGSKKIMEDLVVAQKKTNELQLEKKDLESKLQNALKEAARAKEELKLIKTVSRPSTAESGKTVSADTTVTRYRRTSSKSASTTDSKMPSTEQLAAKKDKSEELPTIKPSSESKGRKTSSKSSDQKGVGKPSKKSGQQIEFHPQQQVIDAEGHERELANGKETLIPGKKTSVRHLVHATESAHIRVGRRPSVYAKVSKEAISEEPIVTSKEAQRADKREDLQEALKEAKEDSYAKKETVALDSTKEVHVSITKKEKEISDVADLSPDQKLKKDLDLQISQIPEGGEKPSLYVASETHEVIPSDVSAVVYETGPRADSLTEKEGDFSRIGFQEISAPPASPVLFPTFKKMLPADTTQLPSSEMKGISEKESELRALTIEQQQKMQQAPKLEIDQLKYPVELQTQAQLEAAKWETDQYGRPIRALTQAEIEAAKWETDQYGRPIRDLKQAEIEAAKWETDQYGRPIRDLKQAEIAAAQWETDQYGRPIRALTQAEMAAARGETDQYGRPIRAPTQAEMEAAKWETDQYGRPIRALTQAEMEAAKWETDQYGRPIRALTKAEMEAAKWEIDQYGRPIRALTKAEMEAEKWGTDKYGRPIRALTQAEMAAAKWETDQYGRPIRVLTQAEMAAAKWETDQHGRPIRALTKAEMEAAKWETDQYGRPIWALTQAEMDAGKWETDQYGRPIRAPTQAEMAAARGEIDQYGRPIRTLTQAEMMQAAARGEIDQYGRPIRTLTQAEMPLRNSFPLILLRRQHPPCEATLSRRWTLFWAQGCFVLGSFMVSFS
ncbi:coiled-coil domain-containing protein 7 [Rhinatrema bivittatum]|uniref:coiled-coil domain-containing protein 7 n=1 Tax=Rhinatrema bivittatum TaxID=194408 RepID=UPI001127A28D|nr:coiled-coil domain-containing protein 7 [Rhinatrema bivittatum]